MRYLLLAMITLLPAASSAAQTPTAASEPPRICDGGAEEATVPDPRAHRLFVWPTGRALPARTGYAALHQVFFPIVGYGITDRASLATGTHLVHIAPKGGREQYVFLAPKLQLLASRSLNVSVGAFSLSQVENPTSAGGLAYLTGTVGDTDSAVTAGLSWPFQLDRWDSDVYGRPILTLGGERQVHAAAKLLVEAHYLTGETSGAAIGGVRLLGRGFSADLGIAGALSTGSASCCLPWVNLAYHFGGVPEE